MGGVIDGRRLDLGIGGIGGIEGNKRLQPKSRELSYLAAWGYGSESHG